MRQPEIHYNQIQTQEMPPGTVLSMPLDAPAVEQVDSPDGPVDVLARLRSISGNNSYRDFQEAASMLVVRDNEGSITFRAVGPRNNLLASRQLKQRFGSRPTEISTPTGAPDLDIMLTAPADKHSAPSLHIAARPGHQQHLRATTAIGAAKYSEPGTYLRHATEANDKRSDRRLRRLLAGAALGGTLLYGGFSTGGAYDSMQDEQNKAGTELMLEFGNGDPEQQAAASRVAETMQALDDHDDATIKAGARQFEHEHAGDLLSDDKVASYQHRIETAKSADDIAATLDDLLSNYGKTGGLQHEDRSLTAPFDADRYDLGTIREYASGIVDAATFLPKSYITEANFTYLELSSRKETEDGIADGAYYRSDEPVITLAVPEEGPLESIGGESARDRAARVFLHELGHSRDKNLDHDHSKSHREMSWSDTPEYVVRWAFDNPAELSQYDAANGHKESYAEEESHLLAAGDNNSIAHPDNYRLWASPANKRLLERLVWLEREYAGISNYIIDHAGTSAKRGWLSKLVGR